MKIVLVNTYFFMFGGAERYFFDLAKLLEENGHTVIFFSMHHSKNLPSQYSQYFVSRFPEFHEVGFRKRLRYIVRFFYNVEARQKFRALIEKENPDLIHINMLSYELSHSIILEARKQKIPIVMTLHDHRFFCPQIVCLRKELLCQKCLNGVFANCSIHRCIDGNLLKSIFVTLFWYFNHYILKSWRKVTLFVSPSLYLKNKIKSCVLGANINITVVPNGIDLKEFNLSLVEEGEGIIYFGRLSVEKGIEVLVDAVSNSNIKLKIIGSGPLEIMLKEKINLLHAKNIEIKPALSRELLKHEIANALFVVLPSLCPENQPASIIEAFALGKPVIASEIGGIPEIIKDKETGLLFDPGNAQQLRTKIQFLLDHKEERLRYGAAARHWVEENMSYDLVYKTLLKAYGSVVKH